MRRFAVLAVLALACSDSGGGSAGTDAGVLPDLGAGSCSVEEAAQPNEGAAHTGQCAPVTYRSKPPSSGTHYPIWPVFRVYDKPIPWGYLVHGLEHGAVVIVYNCPDGCPDEVAHAQAFIDNLPVDPLCTEPDPRRVILAPDPTLDVRWAASAWTWTLRASCFHDQAFAAFARDHYGMGREPLCNETGLQPSQLCP
jgi:hypothetical protein